MGPRRQKRRARPRQTVRRSARDGSRSCSWPGERLTFSWFPGGRPTNSSLALCKPRGEHAVEALGTADSLTRHPRVRGRDASGTGFRSEEHTSELQSPYDLVCRLLLEKKKHR